MAFPDRIKRTVEVANPAATAAALTGTLGLAAACWVIAPARQDHHRPATFRSLSPGLGS